VTPWSQEPRCHQRVTRFLVCPILNEVVMNIQSVQAASERAWSTYQLMCNASENDKRRKELDAYLSKLFQAGNTDSNRLTVDGLIYLKKLDSLRGKTFNRGQ
jgi:hypothetical protein